jgi:hypothetical protein
MKNKLKGTSKSPACHSWRRRSRSSGEKHPYGVSAETLRFYAKEDS